MSTKTIFKRIALTAVSALAAGTLTVISVPAASAAPNVAVGTAAASVAASAQGTLNIASIVNTTGAAAVSDTDGSNLSVGLVNVSDITGGLVASTTQTAVLLATGTITVYTETAATGSADAENYAVITVDGGRITATSGASGVNATNTVAALSGTAATTTRAVSIVPNAGATSMTIRMFNGSTTTYASVATALAAPSLGTLNGQVTVTIAATSVAGVMAASTSGVWYDDTGAGGQTADDSAGASSGWAKKTPGAQYANIRVRDAFGTGLSSTTGLLQATATGGALVKINAAGTTTSGTASTAFYTGAAPDDTTLVVSAPSFAPLATTVTITYNGVEVGKKAFAFTGPITKVTLGAPLRINALSATASAGDAVKGGTLAFADAADNVIYPVASDTYYPTSGLIVDASSDRTPVMSVTPTSSATGHYNWNCGTAASTDKAIFDYVNINGTIATSNTATVSCAGSRVAYTASFDKASYTPGEVAILTVTLRDSKGNLAADSTLSGNTSTSVTVGGGVLAVASASTDASALGVVTYRVLTGVTEGTYNAVVNLPDITTQRAVTASYTIKSSSTAVTNAEVLAAIVKLIASINKQIRQLQKQLRR